jgi:hypothetical protein
MRSQVQVLAGPPQASDQRKRWSSRILGSPKSLQRWSVVRPDRWAGRVPDEDLLPCYRLWSWRRTSRVLSSTCLSAYPLRQPNQVDHRHAPASASARWRWPTRRWPTHVLPLLPRQGGIRLWSEYQPILAGYVADRSDEPPCAQPRDVHGLVAFDHQPLDGLGRGDRGARPGSDRYGCTSPIHRALPALTSQKPARKVLVPG